MQPAVKYLYIRWCNLNRANDEPNNVLINSLMHSNRRVENSLRWASNFPDWIYEQSTRFRVKWKILLNFKLIYLHHYVTFFNINGKQCICSRLTKVRSQWNWNIFKFMSNSRKTKWFLKRFSIIKNGLCSNYEYKLKFKNKCSICVIHKFVSIEALKKMLVEKFFLVSGSCLCETFLGFRTKELWNLTRLYESFLSVSVM